MTNPTPPEADSFFLPCVILTIYLFATIAVATVATIRMDAEVLDAALCRAELAATVQP